MTNRPSPVRPEVRAGPPASRMDALHRAMRGNPVLRRFTLANRLLLAMALLPTGMVKLLGRPFSVLPVDTPVGFFFEALYRTGPWWIFLGGVQVVAALLLLVPRTALLGAVLFLPAAVSIVLITWGVGFGNTVWIALGMLAAVTWLLLWDAPRLAAAARPLLGERGAGFDPPLLERASRVEKAGWVTGAVSGMGLWLTTRSLVPPEWVVSLAIGGLLGVVLVLAGWAIALGRRFTPA